MALAVGTKVKPKLQYLRQTDGAAVDWAGRVVTEGYVVDPLPTTTTAGGTAPSWNSSKGAFDSTAIATQLYYSVKVRNLGTNTIATYLYPLSELGLDPAQMSVMVVVANSYDADNLPAEVADLATAFQIAQVP